MLRRLNALSQRQEVIAQQADAGKSARDAKSNSRLASAYFG